MNKNDYTIRLETPADHAFVENLTREAFWNVYRPGCMEHWLLRCLRDDKDFVPQLDLVLETEADGIIGHVCFVRAHIAADDGRQIPIMTFGPISIHPGHQRRGWGKLLLEEAMSRAKAMGAGALCIEGNIKFYGKCGFVPAGTKGIRYNDLPAEPMPTFFLLRELDEGYLEGITGAYRTPEGYMVTQEDSDEFDRLFPPKVRLKLPGQLE